MHIHISVGIDRYNCIFYVVAPTVVYHCWLDLLSAPVSEAYVERVFSVCGEQTAGKRNRLTKSLEKRIMLQLYEQYKLTN